MGRMIDADELLTHIEDFGEGQYRLNLIDPYYVRNAPTVEAIPKAEYEARLKADMVAMLEELQAKISECYWKDAQGQIVKHDGYNNGIVDSCSIIQERIDALRGKENEG